MEVLSEDTSIAPLILILVIAIIAGISYAFQLLGYLERLALYLYPVAYLVAFGTYAVALAVYVWDSTSIEQYDPQGPIALLASRGGGPLIAIPGEFLQVLAFIQTSKLIINGIYFGQWNAGLGFINHILLSMVGVGFFATSAASIMLRAHNSMRRWPGVL